jgi:hypothetical protein
MKEPLKELSELRPNASEYVTLYYLRDIAESLRILTLRLCPTCGLEVWFGEHQYCNEPLDLTPGNL